MVTSSAKPTKRCLVTGGAGFIGSHLIELLVSAGHSVITLDNLNTGREENLRSIQTADNFDFFNGDIRDFDLINRLMHDVDWVFHLAGMADIVPSIENPRTYFDTNVQGTLNVMLAADKNKVSKIVYAASSSCYGLATEIPTTEDCEISVEYPYALTKWMAEELVLHWGKVYDLPVVSLRLFNVYGPRARTQGSYGSVLGVFLKQKLEGKPFTLVGDGTQTRDFIYVTDVAEAFFAAARSDIHGMTMNIGNGKPQSVNRLIELLEGPIIRVPKRPGEPDCTHADISRALKYLDWSPKVSFEEGIQNVLSMIDDWRDAPLWTPDAIADATKAWFEALESEK